MLSTDEPGGDKHKMERFLHAGRQCVLSVIGPLAFGPLPLLAFQRDPAGHLQLVASGKLLPPLPLHFPACLRSSQQMPALEFSASLGLTCCLHAMTGGISGR